MSLKTLMEESQKDSSKVLISEGPCSGSCNGILPYRHCMTWPFRETRRKCSRSCSTQLKMMELNSNFNFCASSAHHYEFLKQDHLKLFKRIRDEAAQGRFKMVGGSWVEFDGKVPSGESMYRQFMYGLRFFKENFWSYFK
ncbi:unnamed protein product [Moneuplotes crassus]|uniref:Glycoside hydrolase family 38 N-terminal domain-containing protein n=1 Tax=Euplotes crassus TaxID=5936 RepID=A0AAD1XQI5_EUPCR|nr:unnamed protein product [Moneuplotes crassus]